MVIELISFCIFVDKCFMCSLKPIQPIYEADLTHLADKFFLTYMTGICENPHTMTRHSIYCELIALSIS